MCNVVVAIIINNVIVSLRNLKCHLLSFWLSARIQNRNRGKRTRNRLFRGSTLNMRHNV